MDEKILLWILEKVWSKDLSIAGAYELLQSEAAKLKRSVKQETLAEVERLLDERNTAGR